VFIRILFLGSYGWMSNVFLGHSMNVRWIFGFVHEVCSSYILHNVPVSDPFQFCLGTSAGERKVELSLHAHVLGDLVYFVQYMLPYVSNPYWI